MKLKFLLLFILAAGTLSAQSLFYPKQDDRIEFDTNSYISKSGINIRNFLLEEYTKYETECYNDSTFVTTIGRDEKYPEHAILVIKSFWKHREPTFTGFMEYLRRNNL